MLERDTLGPRRIRVDHDYRGGAQQTCQEAHMVASHRAGTDHGGPNRGFRAQGELPSFTSGRRGHRAAPSG